MSKDSIDEDLRIIREAMNSVGQPECRRAENAENVQPAAGTSGSGTARKARKRKVPLKYVEQKETKRVRRPKKKQNKKVYADKNTQTVEDDGAVDFETDSEGPSDIED